MPTTGSTAKIASGDSSAPAIPDVYLAAVEAARAEYAALLPVATANLLRVMQLSRGLAILESQWSLPSTTDASVRDAVSKCYRVMKKQEEAA